MFKEIRRSERSLSADKIEEILHNGEYGVLSTTGENGYAYGVPLSYVYDNGCIYFHCAQIGQKIDNIVANPLVSFCVVGKTKVLPASFSTAYESVILFGHIVTELSEEDKWKCLRLLVKKYSPDFKPEGDAYIGRAFPKTKVMKLEIEHLSGKGRNIE
jgi:nitroimidazol reductase NimA-like FMN-containing flavoprotein (pyridoxamine 5'-phosphate oxidase superfamily)